MIAAVGSSEGRDGAATSNMPCAVPRRRERAALGVVRSGGVSAGHDLESTEYRMGEDVVGTSAALVAVLREAAPAARLDASVLITGETGTGKSQLARAIHARSGRSPRAFVEVNCAAVPEHLFESELFGAMPGAHSTALRRVQGKIEAAEGGTLFLDEVSELARPAQAKLLQFLSEKRYCPLGSSTERRANVRVIAATNCSLEAAIREQRFRSDLFFRLEVVTLRMPSLAERREDIAALAHHLCARACRVHGIGVVVLGPDAVRALEASSWPGNVRQLANMVERALIRAAGAGEREITTTHLGLEASSAAALGGAPGTFHEETKRFQARMLRRSLVATGWNVSATATALGLTRAHTYNLMKEFEMSRPTRGGSACEVSDRGLVDVGNRPVRSPIPDL